MRRLHARELNEHLFDVGITAVAQCQESDGTCESRRSAQGRHNSLKRSRSELRERRRERGREAELRLLSLCFPTLGDEMREEIKLGGYVTPQETLLYRYALDM